MMRHDDMHQSRDMSADVCVPLKYNLMLCTHRKVAALHAVILPPFLCTLMGGCWCRWQLLISTSAHHNHTPALLMMKVQDMMRNSTSLWQFCAQRDERMTALMCCIVFWANMAQRDSAVQLAEIEQMHNVGWIVRCFGMLMNQQQVVASTVR